MPQSGNSLLSLAAQIVVAHVENNDTPDRALPDLIREVYQALAHARSSEPARALASSGASGEETVFADHLVCMECGVHMKMLKRHLITLHNTTPAQYRARWRLPGDYPMVAREYASLRSSLAKDSGLGKSRRVKQQ
jgi:predicted transcriptional regulator